MTHSRLKMCAFAIMMMSALFVFDASAIRKVVNLPLAGAGTPDFAFPEAVATDAAKRLEDNLKQGDWLGATRSVIDLTIAEDLRDKEQAPALALRIDSMARVAPAPYGALLSLLEARLYSDIYTSDTRVYNARTLPADTYPDSPFEWSGLLFRQKIGSLASSALADPEALAAVPLQEIAPLVENADNVDSQVFPTVLDFAVYRAMELCSGISDTEGARRALTLLTSRHDPQSFPYAYALTCEADLDPSDAYTRLTEEYTAMQGSEPSMLLIADAYCNMGSARPVYRRAGGTTISTTDLAERRTFVYRAARELAERYPESRYAPEMRNIVGNLSEPSVDLSFRSQYLSTDSITADASCSNVNAARIDLYRINGTLSDTRLDKALKNSVKVASQTLDLPGETPFEASAHVAFAPQAYGEYFLVACDAEGEPLAAPKSHFVSPFTVSDLSIVASLNNVDRTQNRIYVVSAVNQKPVRGAKVRLTSRNDRGNKTVKTLTTNGDGYVTCGVGSYDIVATRGKDAVSNSCYASERKRGNNTSQSAQVLTDLSIYHPGDTIGFVVVAYEQTDGRFSPLADRKIQMTLNDANGQRADTVTLVTDASGRASGRLAIPASGLNGRFTLMAREDSQYLGMASVQVADYKAPTFAVEVSKEGADDGTLRFRGNAKTFTGMAVAGGTASYSLKYVSWWMRGMSSDESQLAGEATLDDNGDFTIDIPQERLNAESMPGCYVLTVDVTSPTGETQSAPALRFSVGEAWRISPSIPSDLCVSGDETALSVSVLDVMDKGADLPVDYAVANAKGVVLASGTFTAPTLRLATRDLPSGEYTFTFTLPNDTTVTESSKCILWRTADKFPPVETPLWVPLKSVAAQKGADNVKVTLGSAYSDSWILIEVADGSGFLSRKWMHMGRENKSISVPAPSYNERIRVYLTALRNCESRRETIVVEPYEASVSLDVETVSFRDKIVPGDTEHWSFRFTEDSRGLETYAMAVLSDKALNDIAPFRWNLAPLSGFHFGTPVYINPLTLDRQADSFCRGYDSEQTYSIVRPDWNFYGYPLFPVSLTRNMMYMAGGSRLMSAKSANADMVDGAPMVADYAMAETAASEEAEMSADSADSAGEGSTDLSAITLSDYEHPLAFFRPDLTSDAEGNVAIGFEVPDYNTTWQLQLLGYDRDMRTALLTLDAVSAKPVMVSINAPRFLRTGDVTEITALLSNNTDGTLPVGGVMEIIDPSTGEVLHRHDTAKTPLEAGASRVVSIDYAVPYDREMVILRAYALTEGHSDGEQVAIALLPSSQPVIESEPFYLPADTHSWSTTLPRYGTGSQVTLSYCANPAWLCVTTLPVMASEQSASVLSKVRALYANALAHSLVSKNPRIGEAISAWSDAAAAGTDSTLYSNLQRNASLKSVALDNTPWVQDAAGETARMFRLSELLDRAASESATRSSLTQLQKLQNSDGGWSWCPSMRSSFYVTAEVLRVLGQLREASALPTDVSTESMVAKGSLFCQDEIVKMYEDSKHVVPVAAVTRYLYATIPFELPETSQTFRAIKAKALDAMQKNWRGNDVGGLATTAMVLWHEGRKASVPQMMESLRQRAVYKPERGMHYANLEGSSSPYTPLLATARVLRAYAQIDPESVCVDRLRQWIVMQKQAQMWNDPSATVEVVSALLACGSDWLVPAHETTVRLNGKTLEVPRSALFTGEFVLSLDPTEASGAVIEVVNDTNAPSWGGVLSSRIAPMKEVKSASTSDLKIQKQVFVVENDRQGRRVEDASTLATGQRVRVTMTLTSSRDIEFVALTDPRAACLEPLEQLSRYASQDGLFMYRETRNAATDFFIEYLPKGTHVVSYDCFVNLEGRYASGVATAQSIYAPTIVCHSAGSELTVGSED